METTIHTDRLTLRLFNSNKFEDYDRILELLEIEIPRRENEIPGFIPRTPEEFDRRCLKHRLHGIPTKVELPIQQFFLVYCGDKFVGLTHLAHRWAYPDIGYLFIEEHRGQGYASEATKAALTFWNSTVGIPEIFAAVSENNPASERVAEKIGLQFTSYITVNREDGSRRTFSAYMMPGMKPFPENYEVDEKKSTLP